MSYQEGFKKSALAGVGKMIKNSTADLSVELAELKQKIESLPLVEEKFNPDDKPVQHFFQFEVGWKVSLYPGFKGINSNFYKGLWDAYRYSLSLVSVIAADDQLLEIAKLLDRICDKAIQAVFPQNEGTFHHSFYLNKIAEKENSVN